LKLYCFLVSPIVWRIEHFDVIDSTNTWLGQRALEGAPEGLVAVADFQSAGRGRLDRTWESPPGASLLCSILLRPDVAPDQLQLVVACVALATRAALVRLSGVRPGLKWPNDLVVGDAKIAGLLAEIIAVDERLAVVVGLGVNLTHEGPSNVVATSLRAESGVTVTPPALLDIVLDELETRRALLDTVDGQVRLREEYQRALSTLGQVVRVERTDDVLVGLATAVDDFGQLLVQVDGKEVAVTVGDVVHVRAHDGAT
jgi:BirA family transcriptional regulator, biotin operon repressor / biotin---[acetyl-CoA-carboxylase] ligase